MTVLDTTTRLDMDVTGALCALYRELDSCSDLRPEPHVNSLFARLVHLVLTTPEPAAPQVLDDPVVCALAPRLRELCARGETELERTWAERIRASSDPGDELALFPYLDNYRCLVRMEIAALAQAWATPDPVDASAGETPGLGDLPAPDRTATVRSVAFIGSGPMPLSSLLLAEDLGVPVDSFDRDGDAVAASRDLARALGRNDLRVHHKDAAEVELRGYDVVVLAALVGETAEQKAVLLRHLAASMDPGALLLLRSARGMRTLLYPEIGAGRFDGFDVLAVVHPDDEVINSAIVLRKRGDRAAVTHGGADSQDASTGDVPLPAQRSRKPTPTPGSAAPSSDARRRAVPEV
ncbi:nicotianamine synthase family protein [Phytoactinopolyspora endophytica]|uniref:nicotianamine synthase family protein n=1 Tax=Phytoactinopolyspora endophytica TaxID=1642495 RepID=UPI00101D87A4|nr:nicotianamine synthase family protein [Phytoactinopolyspora endophytica]